MRSLVDRPRLATFLRQLGAAASRPARVYLAGGATAVWYGWRDTTIDVDLKLIPDADELLRAIARLKERLELNVELAAPDQFIPPLPDWQARSPFFLQEGRLSCYHYDPYAQLLAKLERGHAKDLLDARSLAGAGWVEPQRLLELFAAIEPLLYRYPAIDPPGFRRAVERFVADWPVQKTSAREAGPSPEVSRPPDER